MRGPILRAAAMRGNGQVSRSSRQLSGMVNAWHGTVPNVHHRHLDGVHKLRLRSTIRVCGR